MKSQQSSVTMQNRFFYSTFLTMVIQEFSQVGAGFIDGLVIGRYLGSNAIAAGGIAYPFFSAVGMLSGVLMVGTQRKCIHFLAKGDKKNAEESFNTAFWSALFFSIPAMILLILFSKPIAAAMGAEGNAANLLPAACQYLIGLAFGVPALVFVPLIIPLSQMHGKLRSIRLSMFSIMLFDVLLDFSSVFFGWGMLGMGLSTGISQWIGLLILVIPFRRDPLFAISPSLFRLSVLIEIIIEGSSRLVKRLCNLIRPLTLNAMIISIGGASAMSAMSIRNNFNNLFECVGAGLGSTVLTLATLYVGEHNGISLLRLRKKSLCIVFGLILAFSVLSFFFAPQLAAFNVRDDQKALLLGASAIRYMSIDLLFFALMDVLTNYWLGIGRRREINCIIVLQKLIYPLLCSFVLGKVMGSRGIWLSFPLATALSVATFSLLHFIQSKGELLHRLSPFPIPVECSIDPSTYREYTLTDLNSVCAASEDVHAFYLQHGVEPRKALSLALVLEESSRNIIEHGFPLDGKKHNIAVFASVSAQNTILRIQDDCLRFDIEQKYNALKLDEESPEKSIGLRLMMRLPVKVKYVNTFQTNNVIITL